MECRDPEAKCRLDTAAPMVSLALVTLLSGCAGGAAARPTVTLSSPGGGTGAALATNAVATPSVIYVSDFYLPPSMLQPAPAEVGQREGPVSRMRQNLQSRREDDPAVKARKLITAMGEAITRELNHAGYRAEYRPHASGLREQFFPEDAMLPKDGWLLGGWFEQVQENNRVGEATVGFGEGSGKISIEVVVCDLAADPHRPFLVMGSENARHRMPGGLITLNPYAMAAKFVLTRGETERDVKAMGSAIARGLVQYIQHGPSGQAQR